MAGYELITTIGAPGPSALFADGPGDRLAPADDGQPPRPPRLRRRRNRWHARRRTCLGLVLRARAHESSMSLALSASGSGRRGQGTRPDATGSSLASPAGAEPGTGCG